MLAATHRPSTTQQLNHLVRRVRHQARPLFITYGRRVAGGMAAVSVLAMVVQLGYPRSRTLPFTRVGDATVAVADTRQLAVALDALANKPVQVRAARKTYQIAPAQMGLTYDATATMQRLAHYPVQARLVPFSVLFYASRKQTGTTMVARVDQAKLRRFAEQLVRDNSRPPAEGSVSIEQGKVVVRAPQAGIAYDVTTVMQELQRQQGSSVAVSAAITQPVFSHDALLAAQAQAQQYAAKPFVIKIADHTQGVGPETVLSWLRFTPDQATRQVRVAADTAAVKATVSSFAQIGYIAPTAATVQLLDGREVSRSGGSQGRALNIDATVQAVAKALAEGRSETTAAMSTLPAPSRAIRSYSSSNAGLQSLLNDWVGSHYGPRWGIVIKEIAGSQRTASVRAGDQFVTASVYKPFVSMVAQSKIEVGQLDPAAMTSTGKSVDACIELMIVHSDNACAHAMGDLVGWGAATNFIQAKGFTNTSVASQYNFYTTPNDTTAFLESLAQGSLMGATQNARLLDMMRRQVYRNGIPTGSRGAVVANKVGYTDGYRHDIGIVYHPKGAYALSVLSYGGTYPAIVDLARTVYDYFNQ